MLHMNDSNFNFNANSTDGDRVIANMSGSYSGADVYFSLNLMSKAAADVTIVKADFASFIDRVVTGINNIDE